MNADEFIKSDVFEDIDEHSKELFIELFERLKSLDFIVVKRNEPVLVLKVKKIYDLNPKSKANIATIRLRKGYITVGPYINGKENPVKCMKKEDINQKLIHEITEIYNEKLQ